MIFRGEEWRQRTRAGALILDYMAEMYSCDLLRSEARLAHISVIADARAEAAMRLEAN